MYDVTQGAMHAIVAIKVAVTISRDKRKVTAELVSGKVFNERYEFYPTVSSKPSFLQLAWPITIALFGSTPTRGLSVQDTDEVVKRKSISR